ncbi:hypothetical protein [Thalassotalea sp. PLHSN55]|uniref:hypothetical protein n=1 Tax=Thalassotalea sp. PLHSN55 TaxID=3435888 RepID=UPI003F83A85D
MKSATSNLPIRLVFAIFAVLTLLMLATRTHHFASLNHLPSASIAIFFLAGMYLRNMKAFWFFYLLSVTIDMASSYYRGQFGDCITTSYPALVLSYGVMFAAGFYARPNWQQKGRQINVLQVAFALFAASSIAFFISNGSYYAFSGKFPELSWAEYSARVDKYFFKYIVNPTFYVLSAVVIDFNLSHFFADKTINNAANVKHKH